GGHIEGVERMRVRHPERDQCAQMGREGDEAADRAVGGVEEIGERGTLFETETQEGGAHLTLPSALGTPGAPDDAADDGPKAARGGADAARGRARGDARSAPAAARDGGGSKQSASGDDGAGVLRGALVGSALLTSFFGEGIEGTARLQGEAGRVERGVGGGGARRAPGVPPVSSSARPSCGHATRLRTSASHAWKWSAMRSASATWA